jgi:hypothetical protein
MNKLDVFLSICCRNVQTILDEHSTFRPHEFFTNLLGCMSL